MKKNKNSESQQSDAEVRVIQTHPNCYKVIPSSGNKEEIATPEKKSSDFMPDLSESSDNSGII